MSCNRYSMALGAALLAFSWTASAQNADCKGPNTPEQIQGKITNVNMSDGKVTVKSEDGKVHVFNAAQATLKDYKVGDNIKMSLRCEK